MPELPIIPETITVHLGPPDAVAENVTLPFVDYVANVASSEIYPTWPENAIRANMLAQISFALNRVYTEYYRTRGYDFDITNTTAFDQSFIKGRDIFENIQSIAREIFNDYIRRTGSIQPLFAQYCNGTTVLCDGLSQWGSVELANQGLSPFAILQRYYGNDIELVQNAPVANAKPSAPTTPLREGSVSDNVRTVQIRLNRISNNYPSIPKIPTTDGVFDAPTAAAVRRFQEIFQLTPDGVVGKSTWYTIQNVYIGVKRLTDLNAEAITEGEVTRQFPGVLQKGERVFGVRTLQFYLDYLSQFYDTIPSVTVDGVFGDATEAAVRDAQTTFGLPPDGIVGEETWGAIERAYLGIVRTIPLVYTEGVALPFPGVLLRVGSESEAVRVLQEYLGALRESYPEIPAVEVTGYFGPRTQEAVIAFQTLFGLPVTGVVDAPVWNEIAEIYETLYLGSQLRDGQYPGFTVGA